MFLVVFAVAFLGSVGHLCRAEDQRSATVGMSARIDQLVLPGSRLETLPLEDRQQPIVLRIAGVFPHGSAHRYDLVYYGLEPGPFDLRDYLQRSDGSSMEEIPSILVEIQPVLSPGQIEPNELELQTVGHLGGYRAMLVVGGIVWIGGLLVILFVGRKRSQAAALSSGQPASLADRLRGMVEDAVEGKLDQSELAELERTLLAYWRRRLDMEDIDAAEAMVRLREHEDAGALLTQLERWLHRPETASEVDIASLLEPYRTLPAETLEDEHPPTQ